MNNLTLRRAFVLITILLQPILTCSAQSAISDREVTVKADQYMKNLVRLDRFSGSVLMARSGKILLNKGYGMANLEYDAPNTPRTKFRVGSITKQFTATAILMLQELATSDINLPHWNTVNHRQTEYPFPSNRNCFLPNRLL